MCMPAESPCILIVDDEASVRDSLYQWFTTDGYRVDTADEATTALKKLQDNLWDIILLDIKMPGMDGIEVLKEIKRNYPLIEVIMLTGHASLEIAREGMKLGAFDYLMKPIDLDELLYKLEDAYQKKTIQQHKIKNIEGVIESRK